jgi:hypothetical protein
MQNSTLSRAGQSWWHGGSSHILQEFTFDRQNLYQKIHKSLFILFSPAISDFSNHRAVKKRREIITQNFRIRKVAVSWLAKQLLFWTIWEKLYLLKDRTPFIIFDERIKSFDENLSLLVRNFVIWCVLFELREIRPYVPLIVARAWQRVRANHSWQTIHAL